MLNRSGVVEFELEEKDFKIYIKTNRGGTEKIVATAAPVVQAMPAAAPAPAPAPAAAAAAAPAPAEEGDGELGPNQYYFNSPMIGTFYRRPSPDKELFVKVGDSVKDGDVVCIIEAMKLFNEIEFDKGNAKVVKILLEDASPVEYDQPLFIMEKA